MLFVDVDVFLSSLLFSTSIECRRTMVAWNLVLFMIIVHSQLYNSDYRKNLLRRYRIHTRKLGKGWKNGWPLRHFLCRLDFLLNNKNLHFCGVLCYEERLPRLYVGWPILYKS